jgi:hypothetical protein
MQSWLRAEERVRPWPFERDLNRLSLGIKTPESPKKRDSKRFGKSVLQPEIELDQGRCIYFGDLQKPSMAFLENDDFGLEILKPIHNTDYIDDKLYKHIDFDEEYKTNLKMIAASDRKHSAMNTISIHTVSLFFDFTIIYKQ